MSDAVQLETQHAIPLGRSFAAVVLYAALAAGLVLRLLGLGFPVTYGPDQEFAIAYALRHVQGDLNPHWLVYPSLLGYCFAVVFWVFAQATGTLVPTAIEPIFETALTLNNPVAAELQPYYLLGRGVSVAFAMGTIVATYLIGKRLYGRSAGALAALFLALMPLHVWNSHYAALDVPLTFWVVLAGYFAACALEEPRERWYCLSGAAAGLAAGTKYPGAVALIMPFTALIWTTLRRHRSTGQLPSVARATRRAAVALGVALAAVGVAAWAFRATLVTLLLELNPIALTLPRVGALLTWIPVALAFLGLGLLVWMRCSRDKPSGPAGVLSSLLLQRFALLVLASALVAFLVVVPYAVLDVRAFLNGLYGALINPLEQHPGFDTAPRGLFYTPGVYFLAAGLPFAMGLPLCLLSFAGFVAAVRKRTAGDCLIIVLVVAFYLITGTGRLVFLRWMIPLLPFLALLAARLLCACLPRSSDAWRVAWSAAILLIIAYTAAFSWSTTLRFARDTRDDATRFLSSFFPEGTSVATTVFPNYYPWIDEDHFRVVPCSQGLHDATALVACDADVIILSGMLFRAAYRDPLLYASEYAGYEALRDGKLGYHRVAKFERRYLNQSFYASLDAMYEGYFVSPTIEVYQRTNAR